MQGHTAPACELRSVVPGCMHAYAAFRGCHCACRVLDNRKLTHPQVTGWQPTPLQQYAAAPGLSISPPIDRGCTAQQVPVAPDTGPAFSLDCCCLQVSVSPAKTSPSPAMLERFWQGVCQQSSCSLMSLGKRMLCTTQPCCALHLADSALRFSFGQALQQQAQHSHPFQHCGVIPCFECQA